MVFTLCTLHSSIDYTTSEVAKEEGEEIREMSRWGKRKEVHASDGDSDGSAPSKKSSKKDSDDPDNIVVCELSKSRRVSVRNWQGKLVVDIREFYVKDGKQIPGKKDITLDHFFLELYEEKISYTFLKYPLGGISLSMDQWNVLRDHAEEIDEAVAENS